ncbi:MAG TPA: LPS assembly lipoprotein LptE [Luteibaculaceae bacterium]|nr:LPS assembly lipoprotein LptE [Luteibaculaceae bacterium]
MAKKGLCIVLAVIFSVLLTGCKISYSFTGADVPSNANTFSVEFFKVSAALTNPSYAQKLTERLKDQLQNQTRLSLSPTQGDLQFGGTVTRYDVVPMAIQGNERAGINRFTITLRVNYVNTLDESKNFERDFTQFVDFDGARNLSDVETALIDEINDKLVQDIFNASLGNW